MTGRLATPPFVEVTALDCIPSGTAVTVLTPAGRVAVFNVAGELHAIDEACIRCGSSLSSGMLSGSRLMCPKCGWQYDIATGCVVGVAALRTDTFPVTLHHSCIRIGTTPSA